MALTNRTQRILVAIISIPVLIFLTYVGNIPFLILSICIGVVAFFEFSKMIAGKNISTNLPIGILSISAIMINNYITFTDFSIIILFSVLLLLMAELFKNKGSAINNLGASLIGIFYIGLFASSLVGLREFFKYSEILYTEAGYLIIAIFASIWVCDSAAYFIGSAIGKHKLFPRVSPKKSWEGAIAGFIFAVVTIIAARELFLDILSLTDTLIIGIIVGIFGQVGDLVESLVKRDAGVKDSSSIIPGHGGIFDRFDSILFVLPMVYLYFYFFI